MFAIHRLQSSHTFAASASSHLPLEWERSWAIGHQSIFRVQFQIIYFGLKSNIFLHRQPDGERFRGYEFRQMGDIVLVFRNQKKLKGKNSKKSPSHRSLSRLTNPTIWLDGNLKDILTSVKSSLLYIFYLPTFTINSGAVPLLLVELKVLFIFLGTRRSTRFCWVTASDSRLRPLNKSTWAQTSGSPPHLVKSWMSWLSWLSSIVMIVMIAFTVMVVLIVMIVFIVMIVTIAPCHRWQSSRSTCSIPPTWTPPVVIIIIITFSCIKIF